MLEVLILTVVSTVSAPGLNRRQGSTSTNWNSGLLVKASKSWRYGAASPGQHDIHHFHKMGGAQVGFSYQLSGGSRENIPELSRFVWSLNSSEQSSSNCAPSPYVRRVFCCGTKPSGESSHFSHLCELHTGEHRGRLPQQTQTAEVGLQTSPIRVSKDLLETASLAHTGCIHIQQESPDT